MYKYIQTHTRTYVHTQTDTHTHTHTHTQGMVRDAWAAAVEKALAKTYGSYEAISGVRGMCIAVDSLTGSRVDAEDLAALRTEGGRDGREQVRDSIQTAAEMTACTQAETDVWKRLCTAAADVSVVFAGSRSLLDEQVSNTLATH